MVASVLSLLEDNAVAFTHGGISCLSLHQRGIRGGTMSAGIGAILAALRLKLPENYSIPQPKPNIDSSTTITTNGRLDQGVDCGGGTDRVAVNGSAVEVTPAHGMGQLSISDRSNHVIGSVGSTRSSSFDNSSNVRGAGVPNSSSAFCDVPNEGHFETFEEPGNKWYNDISEVGGTSLSQDSRLMRGNSAGDGYATMDPMLNGTTLRAPDWLPQPAPSRNSSTPSVQCHLPSSDSCLQPPQSLRHQMRYRQPIPQQELQQQESPLQPQSYEQRSSYQRNQAPSYGSSQIGAPVKFAGYSSMAAPFHAPGPLPSSSFMAAGQRCTTCGGVEQLERDVDNPGDIYCTPCWEAYEAVPVGRPL